jgi:hypothetical protein
MNSFGFHPALVALEVSGILNSKPFLDNSSQATKQSPKNRPASGIVRENTENVRKEAMKSHASNRPAHSSPFPVLLHSFAIHEVQNLRKQSVIYPLYQLEIHETRLRHCTAERRGV